MLLIHPINYIYFLSHLSTLFLIQIRSITFRVIEMKQQTLHSSSIHCSRIHAQHFNSEQVSFFPFVHSVIYPCYFDVVVDDGSGVVVVVIYCDCVINRIKCKHICTFFAF